MSAAFARVMRFLLWAWAASLCPPLGAQAEIAVGHTTPEIHTDGLAPKNRSLRTCDSAERAQIKSFYLKLYREFRKGSYQTTAGGRQGRSASLETQAQKQLHELENSFRELLLGRDPKSCLLEAGIDEESACLLLSASSWRHAPTQKNSNADAILKNPRVVTPSKSNPKLDYVRVYISNPAGGHYSNIIWLVERSTQKVVGWIDSQALSLSEYKVRRETNEYRGHKIVSSNPEFGVQRFEYSKRGIPSPSKTLESCSLAGEGYDQFIAEAQSQDRMIQQWDMSRANMNHADKLSLMRDAAGEGLAIGSVNVYESGKNVVDGARFLWDYGLNNPVDDPFEEGKKIGFRDLVNQSLGQMGAKAFESCLEELCPQASGGIAGGSCSPFAAQQAVACVGGKIVVHFGKEVADYVKGCLEGRARPEEGIAAGTEAISACLADAAVITASFIPVAGAAKVASVGGQGAYRATLLATKSLSPGARKFVRSFTKQLIRGTAIVGVGGLDLTINQLPTSPKDLAQLETFLRSFLKDSALAPDHKKMAQELLERVKLARRGGLSPEPELSRNHLKHELDKAYKASDAEWYRHSVERDLDQVLAERSNFQKYLDEGLKPGEQVYWMQQRELKELNEKLWDIGGTEYYLMTLDRELGALLASRPELGRIVHRNYKDRVVVSSLSPEDFESKVMAPLREKVSAEVGAIKDRLGTSYLWKDYMQDSIAIGNGNSLEDAFLNLQLDRQGMSFDSWKTSTSASRNTLEKKILAARPNESLERLLKEARRAKGDIQKLKDVLKKDGLPESLAPDLMKYMDSLRVADFLPLARPMSDADQRVLDLSQAALKVDPSNPMLQLPRIESIIEDSWVFQRSRFLKEAKEARYMVATDIRGLGERALLAQDRWLQNGAQKAELPEVYSGTTLHLNARYNDVYKKLKEILGDHATVGLYRSGDDALWSLPEMTIQQKRSVDELFRAQADMYHAVVEVAEPSHSNGIADAIHGAREKLFNDKDAIKNGVAPGSDL